MAETEFKGEEFTFPDEKQEPVQKELDIDEDEKFEDKSVKADSEDPTDEELAQYDEGVRNKLKKYTNNYHNERRARKAAQREREEAENFAKSVYEENKRLKEQLESGSKVFIEQNKSTAEMELENAKKKLQKAFEEGDADTFAQAQVDVTRASLRLDKAESMRPIESVEMPEPPQVSKQNTPPKTKEWVENNSDWFGVDEEMTMAAMGLDKKLQKQYGSDYVGSDDYFKTIDRTIRKRFPEHFGVAEENEEPPKKTSTMAEEGTPPRRASSVVAPATRSSAPNRIRLEPRQVSLARKLGVSPEEYAKHVALIERNA
jgi:hypothetical protein